jgi:NIPSNAP
MPTRSSNSGSRCFRCVEAEIFLVSESGRLHITVLMWACESLADREVRRCPMYADSDWQEFIDEIRPLEAILTQDEMIMNPARFVPVVGIARFRRAPMGAP